MKYFKNFILIGIIVFLIPISVTAKIPLFQWKTNNSITQNNEKVYLGNFKITFYCSCSICCGQYSGGPTASGIYPIAGQTCACGPSIPFNTILQIENLGTYTCEDRGVGDNCIDIFVNNHEEALQLGVKYLDVYELR